MIDLITANTAAYIKAPLQYNHQTSVKSRLTRHNSVRILCLKLSYIF